MVLETTPPGDAQAVVDAIDNYAWSSGFLMNIGDRKGAIVEAALHRCQPKVCCNLLWALCIAIPSSVEQHCIHGLTISTRQVACCTRIFVRVLTPDHNMQVVQWHTKSLCIAPERVAQSDSCGVSLASLHTSFLCCVMM